jgi:hypothetical protein
LSKTTVCTSLRASRNLNPTRIGFVGSAGNGQGQTLEATRLVTPAAALFDLSFLVHDVLADHRIKFFDFHLFRHIPFVFGSRIKVPGSGAGNQFDFVTHDSASFLDFFATLTDVGKNRINPQFIDDPHPLAGDPQANPTIFAFNPESVMVKIGIKMALGFIVGVRYIAAGYRPFSGDLANSRHALPHSSDSISNLILYHI